jgi:hypothetical protein
MSDQINPQKRSATNRRDFAKTVALLAAAPLAGGATAAAQETKPAKTETTPAQALAEIVRLRYGKYLTEEQLTEVRRSLERGQASAARMRQFKLQNGDEPAFVFRAELP